MKHLIIFAYLLPVKYTTYTIIVSIHIVDFSAWVSLPNKSCEFFHMFISTEYPMHYDDRPICSNQPCTDKLRSMVICVYGVYALKNFFS